MNRYSWRTLLVEIVMIAATAVYVFPLWIMISVGFRRSSDIATDPMAPPKDLYVDNFVEVWQQSGLGRAFWNSGYITFFSVLITVVVGSAAGYYFARSKHRAAAMLLGIVTAGMMVPFQIGLLPLYRIFTALGLAGNPWSVIIFSAGIHLPLTVVLYSGFMRQLPIEYEESARVDGATGLQLFGRIVLPMLLPVTGTVIILNGVSVWNEFFTPLLYLGGTDNVPVPVRVYGLVGEYTADWGQIFAGLLMASIPVLILFFVFQRYMIRSFGSGLKG